MMAAEEIEQLGFLFNGPFINVRKCYFHLVNNFCSANAKTLFLISNVTREVMINASSPSFFSHFNHSVDARWRNNTFEKRLRDRHKFDFLASAMIWWHKTKKKNFFYKGCISIKAHTWVILLERLWLDQSTQSGDWKVCSLTQKALLSHTCSVDFSSPFLHHAALSTSDHKHINHLFNYTSLLQNPVYTSTHCI